MHYWILLFPLITSFTAWLLACFAIYLLFRPTVQRSFVGLKFQGIIPAHRTSWTNSLAAFVASQFSLKDLEEKIAHPDNIKKIMPQAEIHIDAFLRVKLVKTMPVVGMLIGERTINSLKGHFMSELEQIFPDMIRAYLNELNTGLNVEALVINRLAAIPDATIERLLRNSLRTEIKKVQFAAALFGFLVGIPQVIFSFASA